MTAAAEGTAKLPAFQRGVHPPEGKAFSADMPIKLLPAPPQVFMAMLQHTGAPCEPTVKAKDEVAVGDVHVQHRIRAALRVDHSSAANQQPVGPIARHHRLPRWQRVP